LAGSDIVGQARDVTRVTHEDGRGDLGLSSCGDGNGSVAETFVGIASSAVSIVKDLTTLSQI
jgi:hypothetical protein